MRWNKYMEEKMEKSDSRENCCDGKNKHRGCCKGRGWKKGGAPCLYGLGFIGAAIYFIQSAATFWAVVFGVLKAIVWPAIVVYKVLEFLMH